MTLKKPDKPFHTFVWDPDPINSNYLIDKADFIASHKFNFIRKFNMIADLKHGGTFLLNSPYSKDEIWDRLPLQIQKNY